MTLREKLIEQAETHFDGLNVHTAKSNAAYPEVEEVDARERATWLVDELYDQICWYIQAALEPLNNEFDLRV